MVSAPAQKQGSDEGEQHQDSREKQGLKMRRPVLPALVGITCLAVALLLGLSYSRSTVVTADPQGRFASHTQPTSPGSLPAVPAWPAVDWDYWCSVNPDIVGWVTVPGTRIDYPVVQASADDPTYYLNHDVYKNWSWAGVPYLDAGCVVRGLDSYVCVISAHNLMDGSLFADFVRFSDSEYLADHPVIYLQTPTWKRILTVGAVDVVSGTETRKQTDITSRDMLGIWYEEEYRKSETKVKRTEGIKRTEGPDNVYVFVTCSYAHAPNERTLVYGV
jgi:sortase B